MDLVHELPFFAKASKGILLRAHGREHPAKRVARSRMAETEGFEPSIRLWSV